MKLKIAIIIVSLLAVGCFGWVYYLENKKVLRHIPTAWTEESRADCGVVLTGGPNRVREGFDLLVQKRIKKLIISGVFQQADLSEIFPQLPYYASIDQLDIVLEKRSKTTFGNAQQTLPLVEALHCKDLVVITSELHMYRAMRIFRVVFPKDFPIFARAIVAYRYKPHLSDVFLESTKSVFYSLWAY